MRVPTWVSIGQLIVLASLLVMACDSKEKPRHFGHQRQFGLECEAYWTDATGKSHCGHIIRFVSELEDSTGVIGETWHCYTDSLMCHFTEPRYQRARRLEP